MKILLLALLGCPGTAETPMGDTGEDGAGDTAADSGDTAAPDCEIELPEPPAEKDTGDGVLTGDVLTGEVTWTLAFDEEAEANGFVDCTYTRVYDEFVEVLDQGFLCPDCDTITTGDAVMTSGWEDCYAQISDGEATQLEHVGVGELDGALHFFRSGSANLSLGDMGEAGGDADAFTVAWEDEGELTAGGTMLLSAAGRFTRTPDAVFGLPDPEGARTEPYTCGWPMNNPGGPNADWTVTVGEPLPNVRLDDQCDEPVDVWDFLGYYLVVDASSPDCGPCQQMASEAEAFKASMEAQCVPVEVVTLLNAGLAAINEPASLATRQEWAEYFGLTSPVLGDMGYGYAVMAPVLDASGGMSLPTLFIVDPDGIVIAADAGFGGWAGIEELILADQATR